MNEAKVSGHKWAWPTRSLTPELTVLGRFLVVTLLSAGSAGPRLGFQPMFLVVAAHQPPPPSAGFSVHVRGQASEDRRLKSGPQSKCPERKVEEPEFILASQCRLGAVDDEAGGPAALPPVAWRGSAATFRPEMSRPGLKESKRETLFVWQC